MMVLGSVAILEWAAVMGDGGPLLQLLAGISAILVGLPIIIRGLKGE